MKRKVGTWLKGIQLALFGSRLSVSDCTRQGRRASISGPPTDSRLDQIWQKLQMDFFSERLDLLQYKLAWSRRRQKRTLASCNVHQKRVLVAKELSDERFAEWLEPLLYHEMCHAVLGHTVARFNGRRMWHGAEFKALERLHPRIAALEEWIKKGGFSSAVRRHRGIETWKQGKRRKGARDRAS